MLVDICVVSNPFKVAGQLPDVFPPTAQRLVLLLQLFIFQDQSIQFDSATGGRTRA